MDAVRSLALLLSVATLFALFVGFGAADPDPSVHEYAGESEVVTDPGPHVGDSVTASGTVLEVDPVVIEVESEPTGTARLTVYDAPPVEVGQHLTVHGRLESERELRADDGIVRAGWQFTYMYAVSALAALWLVWRAVTGWRFRTDRLGFEPRDRPLVSAAGILGRVRSALDRDGGDSGA